MPEVGTLAGLIWIATILGQPSLALMMAVNGSWKRWPSLFVFIAWQSVKSSILLALYLRHDQAAYFYVFWFGDLLGQAMQVCILIQIACRLCGISPSFRKALRWVVSAAATASLFLAYSLASQVRHDAFVQIMQEVLLVERTVSIAWCLTFLLIAFTAGFAGLRWRRELLGVSSAFALEATGNALLAWALTAMGPRWAADLSNARGLIYLCALYVFAEAIRRGSPAVAISSRSLQACKHAVEKYSLAARDR
jgi:hypothetical protein